MADYCTLQIDDITVFATHGHIYNMENVPPLKKGDILLHGHTHVPTCVRFGGETGADYIYMNPGSLSIPKEDSHHGYMICEGSYFTWKDLDGKEINIL